MTLEELANNLSKSQSSIANKIRLLKLSDSVRKKMIQYQLTEQHGRAILKIPEEEIQLELLDHIAQKELTVKQTEELVAEIMEQMCQPKQKHIQKEKRYIKDIRLFTNSIRQSINIIKKSGMHVSYENNPKEVNIPSVDSLMEIRLGNFVPKSCLVKILDFLSLLF